MGNKIDVVLADKYDLVVGDTFQLYYRGIIEAPNPYVYDILVVCQKGKGFPRYYEFIPEEEGEYTLTISVFDAKKNLLGKGETILSVKEAKEPENEVNFLCFGDSGIVNGIWPGEARRRLCDKGGEPEGFGFKNINFIGGVNNYGVNFEGFGGWMWDSYLCATSGDVWVHLNHNKTLVDQHSIWQDEDGNLWQLETLDVGRLKFTRYGGHKAERRAKGVFTHVRNATHTEPVEYYYSYYEAPNPFFDEENGEVSFKYYCKKYNVDKLDAIYVLLGYNGLACVEGPINDFCKEVVAQAKKVVDIYHRDCPDGKVKVMGLFVPSTSGGVGTSYGTVPPYGDYYGLLRYAFELNRQYKAWANEPCYKDFVEYIDVSGQFDCENNYPEKEIPVNSRSSKTEKIGINGLHCIPEGYMQMADAAFRNMVHLINEK